MKEINFKNIPLGILTETSLKDVWGEVSGVKGVDEGLCSIVDIEGENVLEVTYLKGKISDDSMVKWNVNFDKSYDEYTVEYKVRLPENFDFVRGGKFPGLFGGTGPAGGASVENADGFSARVMWRELGLLVQYVYYIGKDGRWGKDFIWTNGDNKNMPIEKGMWKSMNTHFKDRVYLIPNKWFTLKTFVKMNTPGKDNGKIISWLDGSEVLNINLKFRNDLSFGIDTFKFTTFFGGNDETWAPKKDEKIYFKDFIFY